MKYDGCRILASVGGGHEPVLWTRNMNVVTTSYPEIAEALTAAFGGRGRIVLDGEVVVLDRGKPSFGLLQRRMVVARATKPLQKRIPVTFLPFDALALDGNDLTKAAYLDRRAELAELDTAIQDVGGLPITVPPFWENQSSKIMLNAAKSAGMEGSWPRGRPRSTFRESEATPGSNRSSVLAVRFWSSDSSARSDRSRR